MIQCIVIAIDIINNHTRSEIKSAKSRCSSAYRFSFQWDTGNEDRSFPLAKACIRVYSEVIYRLIPLEANVSVNVSVMLKLAKDRDNEAESESNETSWIFVKTIDVGHGSAGWIELDISQQLETVWEPVLNKSILNVGVKLDVDCKHTKKVPLKIMNPATLKYPTGKREKRLSFQPFLVVFIDDTYIKRKVKNEQLLIADDEPAITDKTGGRKKRNSVLACRVENFTVNFRDLKLTSIISPSSVNIKQCAGSCSLNHVQVSLGVATNHARLMSSAAYVYRNEMSPPEEPCCSPTAYYSKYLIMIIGGFQPTIEVRLYTEFVVKECGCR